MLTIAIPTFNRVERLINCLSALDAELTRDVYDTEIEVIVSDNFSQDTTWSYLQNFKFTNGRIRFTALKNDKNLGSVANIKKIIVASRGAHILWCTDDDYILPGSLRYLVTLIKDKNPSYLKTSLIMYLENSKEASYYGSRTDLWHPEFSARNFMGIFKYSHILTGTIISKEIAEAWLELDSSNCYPSSMWCALATNSRNLVATPCFIHTWENQIYWELDVKVESNIVDSKFLLESEQTALCLALAEIKSFEDSIYIREFYFKSRLSLIKILDDCLPRIPISRLLKYQLHFIFKSTISKLLRYFLGKSAKPKD